MTVFFFKNQHLYPATCDYDKDAVPRGTELDQAAGGVWVRYNVGLDGRMAVLGRERE
jgi:hypothetical protein